MPVGKFDETLKVVTGAAKGKAGPVQAHIVKARGPLDTGVARIVELCVWVLQRADLTKDDAAANAMGPEGARMPGMDMVVVNPARTTWEMDLTDRDETEGVDFVAGSA